MKRSEINSAIRRMEALTNKQGCILPPFCGWTPEDWLNRGGEYNEIRDNMLGWDVTDYGLGHFSKVGFTLITLRNGNVNKSSKYTKPYAEKLYEPLGRFPIIEEDAPPYRLLCTEYPVAKE